MTAYLPSVGGRNTSARRTRPSSTLIGTSQSIRMPSRTSLTKSVIADLPMPASVLRAERLALARAGSAEIEDEVERRGLAAGDVAHLHHEITAEDRIPGVNGLARKVELRRQRGPFGRLHVQVEVACAARVDAGHDGLKAVPALVVRELMTAQPITAGVIVAALVGVPD